MKSRFRHLLLALVIVRIAIDASPGHAQAQDASYPWQAGTAAVDITPSTPMWMAGYAARKGPFSAIRQPIHAKAIALEDADGGRLVIVTLDLIGVSREMRQSLEDHVDAAHDLPEQRLLINASHTHSGPAIRTFQPPGGGPRQVGYDNIPDDEAEQRAAEVQAYLADLDTKLKTAIDEAIAALAPARLAWSRSRCGFAMNRRTPSDGSFRNFPNPDGPVDHEVPVLRIMDGDGELRAVLFGYACHATVLGDMMIHGDWPGYAQAYFEADHPGVMTAFLNGCSGDQNPYPRRFEAFVERHGRTMATAIEAALETSAVPLKGPLKAAIAWPLIDYDTPPSREELEAKATSDDRYDARHARLLLAELDSSGDLPASYPVPVQVIRFGDTLTLVAIGGEAVVDYSLRLKRELGGEDKAPVWIAGYSNDVMTYIPSRRVREEGGYEGATAMRYVRSTIHPAPWVATIEDTLVETILDLHEILGSPNE